MAPFLLDYAFSTAPIPLQVNSPGAHATARINLAVSNRTPAAYCSQIMVVVPVGSMDKDFCAEPPAASVNTGKWTVASQEIVKGEKIGLPGDAYASILFQCRDQADYRIDYSLVLSLVGVPNNAVGTFDYSIQETSGTSPDNLSPKNGKHAINKQDVVFSLSDFAAAAVDKPTVPATAFANGQPLRLSWESTGTWFQLYAKGNPAPLYAGRATSHTLEAGLTADTQFVLVASVSGDPSHDSPSPGYQPIYLYDALTLVVTNPDLTPKSVTAQGGIAAAGALSGGTLAVTGQSTLAGVTAASATVTGRTTAVGGLDVGTDAARANANVRGDLTVTGSASMSSATMTELGVGYVTARGVVADGLRATGPGTSLSVEGGGVWIDAGDRTSTQIINNSSRFPVALFQNRSRRDGNAANGVMATMAQSSDYGLATNGRIFAAGAAAPLTHLPTSAGHQVVTSPLVLEAEVHLSGSGRLTAGRARVAFDEHTADLIVFTPDTPYRVLVTPTARCAGVIVVEKAAGHFIVEEAADGYSDASFDWIVIARQRALGEDDGMGVSTVALALPDALPELAEAVRGDEEAPTE